MFYVWLDILWYRLQYFVYTFIYIYSSIKRNKIKIKTDMWVEENKMRGYTIQHIQMDMEVKVNLL